MQQLDFICLGSEVLQWNGSKRGEQVHNWLDQLAVALPGDQYSGENIKEAILKHQTTSSRTVIVTTRSEEELMLEAHHSGNEAVHAYHGLLIVEADPEKTKEFFQQTV